MNGVLVIPAVCSPSREANREKEEDVIASPPLPAVVPRLIATNALVLVGGTALIGLSAFATLAGTSVIYLLGLLSLKASLGVTWQTAFSQGVRTLPVGDLIKAGLAAGVFAAAWAVSRRSPTALGER